MTLPLQVPGGIELATVFLMFLVPAIVVITIIVVLGRRRNRIQELRSRVQTLELRVERLEDDDG